METVSGKRVTRMLSLDLEKERKANAKITGGIAYKTRDLLTLSEDNTLTHATDEKSWHVINVFDMTAEQSTTASANGTEVPIYTGGIFNIEATSLNGTALTQAQFSTARAKATLNKIELQVL